MREPNAVDDYIRFNPQTQLFEPVWWRRDTLPFWLYPDEQYLTGAVNIQAAGTLTPTVNYKLPHASLNMDANLGNPLLINELVFEDSTDGTANANWTIFIKDMGDLTQFMNNPVHILNFAGTSQLPALLTEPLFLPTRHNLMVQFAKISGGAVNARFFPCGQLFFTWSTNLQKYPKDHAIMVALINKYLERRKYISPFYLSPDNAPIVLAPGQTGEFNALIGDQGHFEASHILATTNDVFEVEFFNPITRQTLMNGRIHSSLLGNANNPQPFPAGFLVPEGETVRFIVKNISNQTITSWITLRGQRIRAPLKNIADVQKDLVIR
jgi:hypothetical protein